MNKMILNILHEEELEDFTLNELRGGSGPAGCDTAGYASCSGGSVLCNCNGGSVLCGCNGPSTLCNTNNHCNPNTGKN